MRPELNQLAPRLLDIFHDGHAVIIDDTQTAVESWGKQGILASENTMSMTPGGKIDENDLV